MCCIIVGGVFASVVVLGVVVLGLVVTGIVHAIEGGREVLFELDRLQKLGYRIDLVPVEYTNYCMLEMCGHEVFRCNIQNLQFNTPVDSDPVGKRAVQAVVDASAKFLRARSHLWFWSLIENQLFRRSEYAPKDHWPFDVDLESFETCTQCPPCASLKNQK